MTITINGTTGISGVDGSSGTPAYQGNDANTGISFGTDIVTINTGGQARVTTDASGNVGVGTASPAYKFEVQGSVNNFFGQRIYNTNAGSSAVSYLQIGNDTNGATAQLGLNSSTNTTNIGGANALYLVNGLSAPVVFGTGNSERMRIDTSGNVGIGVTPAYRLSSKQSGNTGAASLGVVSINSANDTFIGIGYDSASDTNRVLASYISTGAFKPISFWTSDLQRMQIDTSGNIFAPFSNVTQSLVVGGNGATSSLGARICVKSPITAGASLNYAMHINDSNTNTAGGLNLIAFSHNSEDYSAGNVRASMGATIDGGGAGSLVFRTGGFGSQAERMRLDSSGNLLVGTQSALISSLRRGISVLAPSGTFVAAAFANDSGASAQTMDVWNKATSGNNSFIAFQTEASATERGSISYNRAGGLVVYNTTSDRRAKDIFGVVSDSGEVIDSLKVYNGMMKGATLSRPMLIADEAQAITPYAVTGEKDAVDKDGNPVYQQIDVSSYVPLLIAELQSLRKRVAELENK